MKRVTLTVLLELIQNDRELYELLMEHELLPRGAESFAADEVEHAMIARTLLRDLEVNPPGMEIILRMRSDLLAMQRQVAELLVELRKVVASGQVSAISSDRRSGPKRDS